MWMIEDDWIDYNLGVHQTGHHYCHSNTMSIGNVETYDYRNGEDGEPVDIIKVECILNGAPVQTLYDLILADPNCPVKSVDDIEELALIEARKFADKLYEELQDAYEHECSDENVSEVYDANNILFNEEGVQV
jgi:hypothetical protein